MGGWYLLWTTVFWVVLIAYFVLAIFVAVWGFRDIRRLLHTLDAAAPDNEPSDDDSN